MGTNFYDLKGIHIGKRNAAGLYCWDCNITLCKGGNEEIHLGCDCADKKTVEERIKCDRHWYKACPRCDTKSVKETLSNSSGGRELGFNKKAFKKKVGVRSCSSFTWAIEEGKIKRKEWFKDEYKKKYSKNQFLKMLKECPIRFFGMIGQEFS